MRDIYYHASAIASTLTVLGHRLDRAAACARAGCKAATMSEIHQARGTVLPLRDALDECQTLLAAVLALGKEDPN